MFSLWEERQGLFIIYQKHPVEGYITYRAAKNKETVKNICSQRPVRYNY